MTHQFADITFTKSVKAAQEQYGSRDQNEGLHQNYGPNDQLTSRETEFIALRDTFYIASVSETGWPYVQHRGGPPGFLKVLSANQLAYADFRGNTQLISVGNLSADEVMAFIKAHDLTVEWIIETHAHADHLSAAPYLKEQLGGLIGIGSHIDEVQKPFGKVFNVEADFKTDGSGHFDDDRIGWMITDNSVSSSNILTSSLFSFTQ